MWRQPESRPNYFNDSREVVAHCQPQVGDIRQAWSGMIDSLPTSIYDKAERRMEFEDNVGNIASQVEFQTGLPW